MPFGAVGGEVTAGDGVTGGGTVVVGVGGVVVGVGGVVVGVVVVGTGLAEFLEPKGANRPACDGAVGVVLDPAVKPRPSAMPAAAVIATRAATRLGRLFTRCP
jgi:hypothetical protein